MQGKLKERLSKQGLNKETAQRALKLWESQSATDADSLKKLLRRLVPWPEVFCCEQFLALLLSNCSRDAEVELIHCDGIPAGDLWRLPGVSAFRLHWTLWRQWVPTTFRQCWELRRGCP